MDTNPRSWQRKVIESLVLITAVALVTRFVSDVMGPLVPGFLALLIIGFVFVVALSRR
jgi:hypothetical protein